MNQGLFRLVFSKRLGMYVPAPEVAAGHPSDGASPARAKRRAVLALVATVLAGQAHADIIPLPVSGLQVGGGEWSNAAIISATPTVTTIQQSAPQAIANWLKFNLAAGHTLNIEQQANWAMLHRIHDSDPSIIAGTINAAGNNYFLNGNGIIFAKGAQLNMGSIWALTANNMTDTLFTQGFINNLAGETFSNNGGFIRVEEGAHLNAATGGKVVLFAEDVENKGLITTPEGQTILAAGKKVYLKSQDGLAGMLVEVDSGGTATNLGEIVARQGNVSLVGLAVNQQGRITASTSVRANGSIQLLARDSVKAENIPESQGGGTSFKAQRFGTVTIGANSVTEVLVEDSTEEIGNNVALSPSTIDVQGRTVDVKGTLVAKGGVINIDARDGLAGGASTPVRVFLDDTARLDVSGMNAQAAMEKNQLKIKFYSEEAKDTPILKASPLLGQDLYLDARKGTDLFDIQPYLDGMTQTIAQRMSAGGTVNITSTGDVITKSGSVIDVSGGVIDYAAGVIRESALVYNGRIVPISQADRNTPYDTLANVIKLTDPKSGVSETHVLDQGGSFQQAYRQGKDAGTVNVTSTGGSPLLEGSLTAETRHDLTQRDHLPEGGKFNLITGAQDLQVVDSTGDLTAEFILGQENKQTRTLIGTDMLAHGVNHVSLETLGRLTVDAAIKTAAHGAVALKGGDVDINQDIVTPGGDIVVQTIQAGGISVADDVLLSTAGTWANDVIGMSGALAMPVVLNGGNISLNGNKLAFGQRTVLDSSAGAWQNSKGVIAKGNGGDISLKGDASLGMPSEMRAYGFSKGGKLALSTASNIHIGGQDPGNGDFWLSSAFFAQGGFSHYAVTAAGNESIMTIGDSTGAASEIHPRMQTLQLKSGFAAQVSSHALGANVAVPALLAEGQRAPATVAFSAYGGDLSTGRLTVLENTTVRTDAPDLAGNRGKIDLEASGQLTMLGSLLTPAGDVTLTLKGSVDNVPYDNQQSIWLGERSIINTAGYYLRAPEHSGSLLQARVFDAGNVAINAVKGFVVAKSGSVIDVSGASGQVQASQANGAVRAATVYGAAGSIAIAGREGLLLDGDFIGTAQGSGERGSLEISLTGTIPGSSQIPAYPVKERVLTVTTDKQRLADGLNARDSLAAFEGKAQISTEQINAGQFDHVSLRSITESRAADAVQHDRIELEDGVNLVARQTLALTSPRIQILNDGQARINAAHVTLAAPEISNAVTAGLGLLRVDADWIDLNGSLNISGVGRTELNSRLDIRMRGMTFDNKGSLRVPGELEMTARQIYPVTNSEFTVQAVGPNGNIAVKSSGAAHKAVFSAGGRLKLQAQNIQQDGVVLAPLGEVVLEAEDTLTMGEHSLTSTSAEGLLIPYGYTVDGGSVWHWPNGVDLGKQPMEKSVVLKARDVLQKPGAVVDISGGGDTFAYEFIPGLGGSTDILADKAGVFAIHPGLQGEYAPYDYHYYNNEGLNGELPGVGQFIYVSGMEGIPAGFYPLLPARYALLQGAYMIEVGNTATGPQQPVALLDGTSLVSGYFTDFDHSTRSAYWTTFKLTSGEVFRNPAASGIKVPAEYMLTSGNAYFTQQAVSNGLAIPRLATDAGQLILNASERLSLEATLKTDRGSASARGAMVDIVSDKITVVADIGADDGSLQLTAQSLNHLNAESILLGGSRSQGDEGTEITTVAKEVSFSNTGSQLEVEELIATASDKVTVNAGAEITTKVVGATSDSNLRVKGDGALLAVSGRHDFVYDRINTSANPASGVLDMAAGSKVSAHQSLVLDATRESQLDGAEVTIIEKKVNGNAVANGSVTLGANRILLGEADPAADGMRVDDELLASFGSLQRVTLNSQRNVDLYGDVAIGNANLDITINAAGLAAHAVGGEAEATLTAANLTMKNSGGATYAPGADVGASRLTINAATIHAEGKGSAAGVPAGAGNFTIGGYENVALNSTGDLGLSGNGVLSINAQQTSLTNQRITAATGTDYTVQTGGRLVTQASGGPDTPASTGLGARLAMTADSMALGGNIELLSGQFTARAVQGDLDVVDGARINAGSAAVAFDKYTAYAPGGIVALQADQGDINVSGGAAIDVGGGAGGNAGTVSMTAVNGVVSVADGALHGTAAPGKTAGSFVLDSKQVADFSALNAALNSGGFDALRNLRIRQGDVTIAAGDNVHAGKVLVSADSGSIHVFGKVDASGDNGGDVRLYAKNDLTLKAGSQILAKGNAADGKGGSVLLSAEDGTVSAEVFDGADRKADAAVIDVGGNERGQVNMRAARVGAAGLKVDTDATAAVAGAGKVLLESVSVMDVATTLNATTLNNIATATNAFYTAAGNAAAAYRASSDGVSATVTPHTELRVNGNASLGNDWNLSTLSQGREGALTIRSSGNMQLGGTISDGFDGVVTTSKLKTGDSWSINLVAGADMSAANTLQTVAGVGNMTLANSKMVRTGTGDINIAAGKDFTFGNASSVIYTAGRAADDLAGFTNPAAAAGFGTVDTQYLTGGGDISIAAQGNITGALLTAGGNQQIMNNWLFRRGETSDPALNLPVTWWLRTDLFKQGVAAFGGGNVDVSSGGNITNLSVAVPTTGRYLDAEHYRVDGGGDINVMAAGDIVNGIYYAGRGHVNLDAGGAVGKSSNTFGTVIALQDATASVSALRDVYIESVFNPTLFAQSATNTPAVAMNSDANNRNNAGRSAFFNTYSEQAAVDVVSLTGNVLFGDNSAGSKAMTGKLPAGASGDTLLTTSINSSVNAGTLGYLPGSVSVTAFGGDIEAKELVLMPSAAGNLSLLAAGNIKANTISMSDADVSRLPSVLSPLRDPYAATNDIGSMIDFIMSNHAAKPLHMNDRQEVVIVARDGTIGAEKTAFNISLPKAASIIAGQDILNLNTNEMKIKGRTVQNQIQHLHADDLTVIKAGRDIRYNSDSSLSSLRLAGPGNFMVEAGRHLNLGNSQGINSVANTINAYLPETGASLTVLAGTGQGAHVSTYINTYIDPQGSGPAVLSGDAAGMAAYRASTAKAVAEYIRELRDDPKLTEQEAMAQYLALDRDKQAVFAFRHYSAELLASVERTAALKEAGESGLGLHKRGDDAVAVMFPRQQPLVLKDGVAVVQDGFTLLPGQDGVTVTENASGATSHYSVWDWGGYCGRFACETLNYQGDLVLFDSKIRTARNGGIDIVVPGGMINVGVPGRAVKPGNGIITESGGDIRIFVDGDLQVNQARVISQYGTNLFVWSHTGNIDAGKGSRSVKTVPEVEIFTDVYGNTIRRYKGGATGSGLQANTYDPDGPTGPLEAPEEGYTALNARDGNIDAGEAGVKSGRLLVVANQVLNANNISATTSVGVPVAVTGTVAGTVSGASSVASAATASLGDLVNMAAVQDFSAKNLLPSFVSVEVLGLGDIVR